MRQNCRQKAKLGLMKELETTPIVTALIAAAVAAIGWFATHKLALSKETLASRRKRDEETLAEILSVWSAERLNELMMSLEFAPIVEFLCLYNRPDKRFQNPKVQRAFWRLRASFKRLILVHKQGEAETDWGEMNRLRLCPVEYVLLLRDRQTRSVRAQEQAVIDKFHAFIGEARRW